MTPGRRRWAVLLAVPPLLAAAWLWHPLVGNYFFDDDFPNLVLICNAPLLQYLLTRKSGGEMPVGPLQDLQQKPRVHRGAGEHAGRGEARAPR